MYNVDYYFYGYEILFNINLGSNMNDKVEQNNEISEKDKMIKHRIYICSTVPGNNNDNFIC